MSRTGAPFPFLAITDRRVSAVPLLAWLAAAGELPAVQLREKDLPDGAVFDLLRWARRALAPPARLLANGRVDLALAAGADGVHLPAAEVPVAAVRERFGPGLLIGRSTHSLVEVEKAAAEGADYVTFGPVYSTPSKRDYGSPPGLDGLAEAARVGIPVVALGGVTVERFEEVAAAGAAAAAGIRVVADPVDFPTVASRAREVFGER